MSKVYVIRKALMVFHTKAKVEFGGITRLEYAKIEVFFVGKALLWKKSALIL